MRFSNLKKSALRSLVICFTLLFLAGAGGFLWLRSSLPNLSGVTVFNAIEAPVEIVYDRNGIPHIHAATTNDAYRALGFVHARDRLFQMDFMRRLGAGRLSEVVGKPTIALDRTMRTLGLYRLAQQTFDRLPPDARQHLLAYAEGINGFLSQHPGALPPEFGLLGYTPDQWRPADSLVWGRLMAMRLTGNWRTEALRAALSGQLTESQIRDLWPPAPGAEPGVPATLDTALSPDGVESLSAGLLNDIPAWLDQVSASNSWVLSGKHTESGKPVLANDPHLGFRAPGLWYLARIRAPGMEVTGATVPGVPFHILGHNGRIAWAFTTTGSDTQDLFVERLTEGRDGFYDTPDGPAPFASRQETIAVRGADPVTIAIRETRHGPVISDVRADLQKMTDKRHVIALASAGLRPDDLSALGLRDLNRAGNWQEFRQALRHFHSPHQNVTYADTAGNIGFVAPARVPIRRAGKGKRPAPGWSGTHDWSGFIPFEDLPSTYNPASGKIVNANHRIVPQAYKWYLTDDWAAPYRAQRIFAELSTGAPHTLKAAQKLQNDIVSGAALELLPILTKHLSVTSAHNRNLVELLRTWDGRMSRDRAEPLIFMTWLAEANRALYADELGALFGRYAGFRPRTVRHMLEKRPAWCDDISTPRTETCRNTVTKAFTIAMAALEKQYGSDMKAWRWGTAHPAHFAHPVLGRVPVLKYFADIRVESDGGAFTVNRAQPRFPGADLSFASVHGAGFRAIYDLSDLSKSLFATATGQSGNPLSRRYSDNTKAWRDGNYIKIARDRANAVKDALGILKLVPAK